ncbi:MAG: metallophosphoesterase family protein [Fimbriimonadaceae bacterium]|nr:metallophosphoesterase family protein [Fimbriimonadaceae bacterium]QYK59485.1 MAG: metallophosphoesterase family protein [Fimbriimonadaceae bacterium]
MTLAALALCFAWPQTTTPSRVLLSWSDDPATTATVSWRTDAATAESVGQIALASPDPRLGKDAQSVVAASQTVELDTGSKASYHRVTFTGLKPETLYAYRVGEQNEWSEWFQFKTAAQGFKPFQFVYFGDAQNNLKSMWSRAIRQAHRDAPYAAFMLHAGDLVDKPDSDKEWGEWFYAGGWLHAQIPVVATPGNHEYGRGPEGRALTRMWRPQFSYPKNGLPGLEDTVYSIDFQGVRIVSLNSNERQEEQAPWLEKTLSTNPQLWTIVTFHHPVYSTAVGRDNPLIRRVWQPILQKHKVDLVLQGHDHTYGRKNVPTGANVRDPKSGTVYVVSVSGPKMYRISPEALKEMTRVGEYTQLYQVIKVDRSKLRFEARTTSGELYDGFELTKGRDGSNTLREINPEVPARLEPTPATGRKDD